MEGVKEYEDFFFNNINKKTNPEVIIKFYNKWKRYESSLSVTERLQVQDFNQKVFKLLKRLNFIYYKDIPEEYNCNNQNLTKTKYKHYIESQIEYFFDVFILNKPENYNKLIKELNQFLDWLKQLSKCENLNIFKDKLYHLVIEINNENIIDKFESIKFTSEKLAPRLIGSLDKKFYRKCEDLKEYECNEECIWKSGWITSGCVANNINEVIYNTFCDNYSFKINKEIEEAILFLSEGQTIVSSNLSKRELCKELTKVLEQNIKISGNVNTIWNQIGMTKRDVSACILLMEDAKNHRRSVMDMIKTLYKYLYNLKYLKWGLITIVISILAFTVYYNMPNITPWFTSGLSYITDDTILEDAGLGDAKFGSIKGYKPGVDINFLKQNDINLEVIAGDDGIISLEEFNRARMLLSPSIIPENFISSNTLPVSREYIPQIIDKSINDIEEEIKLIQSQGSLTTVDLEKINILNTQKIGLESYGVIEKRYNPFDQLIKMLGLSYKQDLIKAEDLIITQNNINMPQVVNTATSYIKGMQSDLPTDSINVFKEVIDDQIKYYVINGNEKVASLLLASPEQNINCNIMEFRNELKVTPNDVQIDWLRPYLDFNYKTLTFNDFYEVLQIIPGVYRQNKEGIIEDVKNTLVSESLFTKFGKLFETNYLFNGNNWWWNIAPESIPFGRLFRSNDLQALWIKPDPINLYSL